MAFMIHPQIERYADCAAFAEAVQFGKDDLVITNRYLYEPFFASLGIPSEVLFQEEFGAGEPTDVMIDSMAGVIEGMRYDRIIGIGGGTVMDVTKMFALKETSPVSDLCDGLIKAEKAHELILVPTTCGTGSEVTCLAAINLTKRGTKIGFGGPEMFADRAVLIPELISSLPYRVFATSSIDALVHAMESFTSPKASEFSQLYSRQAMRMILNGYMELTGWKKDESERSCVKESDKDTDFNAEIMKRRLNEPLRRDFLLASTYAGVAFGNAGCAAVHAMSYPLGAKYHVPHGESNYVLLLAVYREYQKLEPDGKIHELNSCLGEILSCDEQEVYDRLELLLSDVLEHKPLSAYGATREDIEEFTRIVMTGQGRLMANNYTELQENDVKRIYESVF